MRSRRHRRFARGAAPVAATAALALLAAGRAPAVTKADEPLAAPVASPIDTGGRVRGVAHQILCVDRSTQIEPYERIVRIGGINADGSTWRITQDEAVAGMQGRRWRFWAHVGGESVWALVARWPWGQRYLEVEAVRPLMLLSLPPCESEKAG